MAVKDKVKKEIKKKDAGKKPASEKTNDKNEKLISVKIKKLKDNNNGHFHIITDSIDDKHVSVGLTTKAKKGKNNPNHKLELDPLGTGKTSFIRKQGTVAEKRYYKEPRKGKMTTNDLTKTKAIGKKAKQKYLEKCKKKVTRSQTLKKH